MAVEPDEILADRALETRARSITAILRCVVCQSQSIDESDAQIARDMRILVRELLVEGKSDEETIQYIVDRYGAFVLLKPPLQTNTLPLWLGPPAMVLTAVGVVVIFLRSRRRRSPDSG